MTVSKYTPTDHAADKNISSIGYSDLKLTLVGENGFNKRGFVDIFGNFKIYVEHQGMYKLEIFHNKFYFEPVVVSVDADNQNPISAYLYTLNTGNR